MSSSLNIPIRDGGPTVEDLYSPAKQKAASRGGSPLAASYRRARLLLLSPARPRLILFLLLLALAALAASRLGSHAGWAPPPPTAPPSYAVLINTWRRGSPLKQTASHYASCPGAERVHVAWAGHNPPESDLGVYLEKLGVVVHAGSDSRFEIAGVGSAAVFSVDDGVIVPCSDLSFAFEVWRSAPRTMVGFVPRMHWLDHQDGNGKAYYKYGGWWSVWWRGTFSMVLTKAAFFHSEYLDLYANLMPASVKDYIARERNCEDIAMSMLVANASGAPPIWVSGKAHEIGSQAISSLRGYSQWRNDCLNDLISLYGFAPLIPTNAKAVDSRHAWFW